MYNIVITDHRDRLFNYICKERWEVIKLYKLLKLRYNEENLKEKMWRSVVMFVEGTMFHKYVIHNGELIIDSENKGITIIREYEDAD